MRNRTAGHVIARVFDRIDSWRERTRQRRRLMALPDRMLCDIGIGRAEAWREFRKPFWRN